MPPAVVVMQRSSRQMLRSFSAGTQPLAIASNLLGCSPTNSASAARLGFFGAWPDSSSVASSVSVKPAACAAAAAEMFDIPRALRMMSPK